MVKVSVIVPVYNVEKYLKVAIESLINQTLREIEILLINDGSTDDSYKIMEKYAKLDSRIKIYSQENQGQSIARNKGLEEATGKYVYFMDSDDYIENTTLEKCYKRCVADGLDIVVFDSDVFFETEELEKVYNSFKYNREKNMDTKTKTGEEFIRLLLKKKTYGASPCVYIFKKKYLDDIELKFYPGIIHEDELFTALLYIQAEKVAYLPEKFFKRRVREGSTMTNQKSLKNIESYFVIVSELIKINNKFSKKQKEIIKKRIQSNLANIISLLNKVETKDKDDYLKKIKSEFKNYLGWKTKIRLYFPKIFNMLIFIKKMIIKR